MTRTTRRRSPAAYAMIAAGAAALGLTLSLTACGQGNDADTTSSGAGGTTLSRDALSTPEAASGGEAAQPDAPATGTTTDLAAQQMLVKTADMALTVGDIDRAAAQLRSITARNGGVVAAESIHKDDGRTSTTSEMLLRVPADKLDATLDDIARVGTVHSRATSSEDVKAQYVDVESRVASLRRSVERLRTLIDRATTVRDIAAIESELSRREADLEAMEAQFAALKDRVAQSTITVRMSTQPEVFEDSSGGFLGGLRTGWRAFLTSIGYLLTGLGAALPFAVAAGIVLTPLLLWVRRRFGRRHAVRRRARMPRAPHDAPASPDAPSNGSPDAPNGSPDAPNGSPDASPDS